MALNTMALLRLLTAVILSGGFLTVGVYLASNLGETSYPDFFDKLKEFIPSSGIAWQQVAIAFGTTAAWVLLILFAVLVWPN